MNAVTEPGGLVWTFGGREFDFSARTHVMGILNVTPDSFSDGGKYLGVDAAVDRGLAIEQEGADVIDVGGESSRPRGSAYGPGAEPVTVDEELRRVIPVIERLAARVSVPVSIDTTKAAVAERALAAGAVLVNDISAFRADPAMAGVVASGNAAAVLMHMKGTPQTMQADPRYEDLVSEVRAALASAVAEARSAGVQRLIVDPGIGFGKTASDNCTLIRRLDAFAALGCPVLVGPSRKAFLGSLTGLPVDDRREASLAAAVACILHGAHILRVHDVAATRRAALVADALRRSR